MPFGSPDARWLHMFTVELARRDHEVRVLSCTESTAADVEAAAQNMNDHKVSFEHVPLRIEEPFLLRKTLSALRPFSELQRVPEFRNALSRELARQPDIVHAEHLFTSYALRRTELPVFTYVHHLETIDWEQRQDLTRSERIAHLQLKRATTRDVKANRNLIAASDRLKRKAIEIGARNITTVPVSLDISQYPLQPIPSGDPVVGVIGSMHWYPSRSAAERVLTTLWPRIHERVPEAKLLVAGRQSKERLEHHFPLDGAELIGEVAQPVDFFGQISTLLYPPVRGSGMKIKVLEAMAYGIPVISNSEGFEGLEVVNGVHGAMAESDDDFVDATVELLKSAEKRQSIRETARTLIEQQYSAQPAVDRLLSAYGQHS